MVSVLSGAALFVLDAFYGTQSLTMRTDHHFEFVDTGQSAVKSFCQIFYSTGSCSIRESNRCLYTFVDVWIAAIEARVLYSKHPTEQHSSHSETFSL